MAQQASIFCGLMRNTTSQIRDIDGADIWVMDPNVQFVDDIKPLSDNDLYRVRGVPGVDWAVRLYKGLARARFDDGNFQQMILLGLDDATLVGAPREIVARQRSPTCASPTPSSSTRPATTTSGPDEPFDARQGLRDERPPGRARRHLQGVADVPDVPDRLHPLQPGHAVRARASASCCRSSWPRPSPDVPAEEVCRRIQRADRPGQAADPRRSSSGRRSTTT